MKKPNEAKLILDGIVKPEEGMPWGFTPDRWRPDSYLWKQGNLMTLSFLWAWTPYDGNLRALYDGLVNDGYDIEIPSPSGAVLGFCHRRGFVPMILRTEDQGDVRLLFKRHPKRGQPINEGAD